MPKTLYMDNLEIVRENPLICVLTEQMPQDALIGSVELSFQYTNYDSGTQVTQYERPGRE